MLHNYKPEWLYESLPYIYAAGGVTTLIGLEGKIAAVSGVLLLSAAVVIFHLRRTHRKAVREKNKARRSARIAEPATPSLAYVAWRPSFETGVELIDKQHRGLFTLANGLIEAQLDHKDDIEFELLLDELLMAIRDHFESEERWLGERHPAERVASHVARHQSLLDRVEHLQKTEWRETNPKMKIAGFVAHQLIVEHMLDELSRGEFKIAPATPV